MANLLSLKRRIRTAGNVAKTTHAMQTIAVSKLKKAQNATVAGRPYVEKLLSVSQNVLSSMDSKYTHEYMKKNNNNKSLVIIFSPDKGLCGGLITNLIREILNYDSQNKDTIYLTVGKKTETAVANLSKELIASFKFGTILPTFDMVLPIVKIIDEYFLGQKVGNVKIISTNFINVFSQKPKIINVLPIEVPKLESASFTLFEPGPEKLLPPLLRHLLEMTIYQHLLESYASEQGARMVAMQKATDNALEITEDLKLEYNKGRQEKITNEILDIGSAYFTYVYE
ncbi:MAG: ATP synthase gamma chain [Candidatus Levybacteria bacterium GW2011_GWA2_37_36]|nr:MAG: ATP synthase gamma chain [Candidatus Levybacteria bacterium GW2011_GWA1_37_16]KKQ33686.1 MAG: ATP synthase gamma chain [Candidatus Levybacteria bacterium GW2011_GWA2_37_36]KKQ37589.1 MAG: ATP synthase gamma chain [Candidatus Levybacteria bacterium GW2011_GWC2_37_7]KKQ41506.1 MAG: ATP synthase gamma chain [Candidatus Levybacteria bacterium GW2011_GWB1_37_8]OGH51023.1 MAG: ATP synthase F1 subunit gamma [Candidatus Levybacteria bacterium RIFCSPLOWO2_12_FULL_37_14]